MVLVAQCFIRTASAADTLTVNSTIPPDITPVMDLIHWRFFTSQNGMTESWIGSVTAGVDGRMWINHGTVESMNCYDGYRFSSIPSPIPQAKVFSDPSGDLWTISKDPGGFQRFRDGRWEKKRIDPSDFTILSSGATHLDRLPFLPSVSGKVYYLLPDRLMLFDYDTGASTRLLRAGETGISRFTEMIRARDGGLWITGSNGVVKYAPAKGTPLSPPEWKSFPLPETIEAENPRNPFESGEYEVFAVADSRRTGKKVLLNFDGAAWRQKEFSVPGNIGAGWRGVDGGIWLKTTEPEGWSTRWNLFRIEGNLVETVKRNRVLSGIFLDMDVTADGCFSIATSSGLGRYAPPIWRLPTGLGDIRRNVTDALETNDGSVFFTVGNSLLLVLHGSAWETIPIPEAFRPAKPEMCLVGGGKLVMGSRYNGILYYDTAKKAFGFIPHSAGSNIHLVQHRSDDSAWIYSETTAGDRLLEILKNDRFESFLSQVDASDSGSLLWKIHAAANGDIWFLGAAGLARHHEGRFQKFGPKDGYVVGGAFCFLEKDDGKIWVGGRDIIQMFDGVSWTVVKSTGLETVRSLTQCSDGSIIAGSGTGIHRYFQNSWITQTYEDGLPDATINKVFEDRAHRLWACSTAGISRYHPESDADAPETYITPQDANLQVAPGGNGRIGFYGVDKWENTLRERLLFSWRIDGAPWSPFQQVTLASFSWLKAGTHRFEVRSIDRNLNVDRSPAVCAFEVLAPWHHATGFVVIFSLGCMMILSLLGFAMFRHIMLEKLVIKRTASLQSEITQRKRAEEERQQVQAQLVHAQRLESIGTLASGVAHEINNPINGAMNYAQLIQDRLPPDSPLVEYTREILHETQRVATIVRNMLAFSRNEKHSHSPARITDIIDGTLSLIRTVIRHDQITLQVNVPENLPDLKCRSQQIQQVLMNLLTNARDALNERYPSHDPDKVLSIGASLLEKADRRWIRVTVEDHGTGIPPEVRERMFDPFYTTKPRDKGTGLGLSISYSIMKEHHGELTVESEPGKFTRMHMDLPVDNGWKI